MNKTKQRMLSLVLIIAALIGIVAACQKQSAQTTKTEGGQAVTTAAGGKDSIVIATMGEKAKLCGQKLLLTLRRDGYKCQIDDLQRNFKGQFKYADRLGAKLAVVIGDNELEHGVATCKDMISGEQTEVRFEDLKAEIDKRLSAEPQECKDK